MEEYGQLSSVSCVLLEGALGCQKDTIVLQRSFPHFLHKGQWPTAVLPVHQYGLIQSLHSMGRDHRICGSVQCACVTYTNCTGNRDLSVCACGSGVRLVGVTISR